MAEYLRNPKSFTELGLTAPRGILLYGPPGNGKTMLARALAKECKCNFIAASGTELTSQIFVGTGPQQIRKLFKLARQKSPCIIFIDEFDALGGKRDQSGQSFVNESINTLLVELDGFSSNRLPKKTFFESIKSFFGFKVEPEEKGGVIVIAATNLVETLDKAVIRPGRFDRKIEVKNPNKKNRTKLLKASFKTINVNNELKDKDYEECADMTDGFSNVEVQNVAKEVGLYVKREKLNSITTDSVKKMIQKEKNNKKNENRNEYKKEYKLRQQFYNPPQRPEEKFADKIIEEQTIKDIINK